MINRLNWMVMAVLLVIFLAGCGGTLRVEVVSTPDAPTEASAEPTRSQPPAVELLPTEPVATAVPMEEPAAEAVAPTAEPAAGIVAPAICPPAVGELANAAGRWQVLTQGTTVTDLAIGDGVVWAATSGGLICWDVAGQTFERYTTLDGLESNDLNAVEVGPDGRLWLGTRLGLAYWDGETWVPVEEIRGYVTDLASAPDGSLWATVAASSLLRVDSPGYSYVARVDGSTLTIYDRSHGLADTPGPWALAIDANGEVWVGQTDKVSHWDGRAWHIHSVDGAVRTVAVGPGRHHLGRFRERARQI